MYTLLIFVIILPVCGEEFKYILHDECINNLYEPASEYFSNDEIYPIRDSRGIIIRFYINSNEEYNSLTQNTIQKLLKIACFLAKIKNLVIIEVHTADNESEKFLGIKNWEVSSVIAGNIEEVFSTAACNVSGRIYSVGYGEFLPVKNPPNNGGKYSERVDIIILCNISGE